MQCVVLFQRRSRQYHSKQNTGEKIFVKLALIRYNIEVIRQNIIDNGLRKICFRIEMIQAYEQCL